MDIKSNKRLIQTYIDAYNSFDVEKMMSVLHENVQFENVQSGSVNACAKNKSEFRSLAEHAVALFSERNQSITNSEIDETEAVISIFYVGTLACDLPNGMKDGDKLEMDGRTEFEFSHGLISLVRDVS
jgi:hypothetical protein